jgi:mRNA-degrading endonuclease toxin of MazEF toxin-antitoxin module
MNSDVPRRGEIWHANTGGKRHTVVIISLDQRNLSQRISSVLVVPFGSYGAVGPTSKRVEPGETGLPEPSFLKAHFISVVEKKDLTERLPRTFSRNQMRELVAMVNRAIDPDAAYPEQA